MERNALVMLEDVTVTRGAVTILDRVTWSLAPGESWAVTGTNGSGKSSFLRVVRGDLWPDQDGRSIRLYRSQPGEQEHWRVSPIGFRERTALVSPELQDTYLRLEIDLTVLAVVLAGFHDTLRPLAAPTLNQLERSRAMLGIVGAGPLHDRPFLSLSRGEGRKVLLARALAPGPSLLFLDEPCAGLDKRSRNLLLDLLDSLAAKGQQYVLATNRTSEIPATATRRARMSRGRLLRSTPVGHGAPAVSPRPAAPAPPSRGLAVQVGEPLIEIEDCTVLFQGRPALSSISWTLCRGEHWAVLGPNGSGKSTLLKLVLGFVHPAEGEVRRPLARGKGLREIRRAMGWVSPEQQAAFDPRLTVEQVVRTGLHGGDRLPAEPPDEGDRLRCREILSLLDLAGLCSRRLGSLSYGQARQVLLARALAARPILLLLDEPLVGLDPEARSSWMETLTATARQGVTLVVTAHYPEDIPPIVKNILKLERPRT
jgi:molybdate transport system ATP-binding protein